MTALAGAVGEVVDSGATSLCWTMLLRQRRYGGPRPTIRTAGTAAFGVSATYPGEFDQIGTDGLQNRFLIAADLRLDNRDEIRASLALRRDDDDFAIVESEICGN